VGAVGAPGGGVPYAPLLLDLLLLDLLVVGDDLADAVDEAALVVGDEAHEDLLLGGVEEHQDAHLAGRRVREVDAARLGTRGQWVRGTPRAPRRSWGHGDRGWGHPEGPTAWLGTRG